MMFSTLDDDDDDEKCELTFARAFSLALGCEKRTKERTGAIESNAVSCIRSFFTRS